MRKVGKDDNKNVQLLELDRKMSKIATKRMKIRLQSKRICAIIMLHFLLIKLE